MKILIIGTGFAPIPAVDGGAIETLLESYIEKNEKKYKDDLTIYSSYSSKLNFDELNKYKYCTFKYINRNKKRFKFFNALRYIINKIPNVYIGNEYMNTVIKDIKKNIDDYDGIIVLNNVLLVPLLKKITQKKIVLYLHNDYLNTKTKFCKKVIDSSHKIFCASKFLKNKVDEIKENDKTLVVYNGIDFKKFRKKTTQKEKELLEKKYNIQKNDIVLLYTGRIIKIKGVLELVNSYQNIKKQVKNVKLLIIGGYDSSSRNNRKYFQKLKKIIDNDETIMYVGKVNYDELYKFYSIANIQIVPSIGEEVFGLTVIEGMLSQIPLIVSNSGGIPEIVRKDCAIIVDKNNIINDLSKTIIRLIKDKELQQILIRNSNNRVLDFNGEFYCDNLKEEIENAYKF